MIESKNRLLKEVYPVLLLGALVMTWAATTHGVAPISNFSHEKFSHEWKFSKDRYPSGPFCASENRLHASGDACMDLTRNDTIMPPSFLSPDQDSFWNSSRFKKWRQKAEAEGML